MENDFHSYLPDHCTSRGNPGPWEVSGKIPVDFNGARISYSVLNFLHSFRVTQDYERGYIKPLSNASLNHYNGFIT